MPQIWFARWKICEAHVCSRLYSFFFYLHFMCVRVSKISTYLICVYMLLIAHIQNCNVCQWHWHVFAVHIKHLQILNAPSTSDLCSAQKQNSSAFRRRLRQSGSVLYVRWNWWSSSIALRMVMLNPIESLHTHTHSTLMTSIEVWLKLHRALVLG